MGIKHSVSKSSGERGYADEWNAEHIITSDMTAKRSHTLIVAANDSKDKGRADYVCDGVADEVQINQAILALTANGGSIILLDGNYNLNSTINLTDNMNLIGGGRGTIINVPENFYAIVSNSKSNIIISNLFISGPGSGLPGAGGIEIMYGSNVKIQDCWLENFGNVTLYFYNCSTCIATNNWLDSPGIPGIYVYCSENVIVTQNIIKRCSVNVHVSNSNYTIIIGNISLNASWKGITINSGDRNLVVANICRDGFTDNGTNTEKAHNITA